MQQSLTDTSADAFVQGVRNVVETSTDDRGVDAEAETAVPWAMASLPELDTAVNLRSDCSLTDPAMRVLSAVENL